MNPLLTLVQHHRLHNLHVFHCTPKMPVVRRQENIPEMTSLCHQILRVLRHDQPFSQTDLYIAALSFREEYAKPPKLFSLEHVKDIFYHWIVAQLTQRNTQSIRIKLLWIIIILLKKT